MNEGEIDPTIYPPTMKTEQIIRAIIK
jgi:hypothetical protein